MIKQMSSINIISPQQPPVSSIQHIPQIMQKPEVQKVQTLKPIQLLKPLKVLKPLHTISSIQQPNMIKQRAPTLPMSSPQILLAKTSQGLNSINENIMQIVGVPLIQSNNTEAPKPKTRGRKKKTLFDIAPINGGDKLINTPTMTTSAPIKPKIKKSDSLCNLMIGENMDMVMKEYDGVYGSDNPVFTELTPTIMTLCGRLSNVNLDESKDTKLFTYDDRIIRIYSNYGESINPYYVEPPKVKSKRGRKPKDPKIKRRPQGAGTSFNSQITFVVRVNIKTYNVKVFRDGGFSISGGEGIEYIADVIKCLHTIAAKIELTMGIKDKIEIKSLCICMKNYKCQVKLKEKQIVDVINLKTKLIPNDIINDIKFDVETALLTITFKYGPQKITVKLFPKSGKINILGSKDYSRVVEIYDYLSDFIKTNPDIIVNEGELTIN